MEEAAEGEEATGKEAATEKTGERHTLFSFPGIHFP